MKKIKSDIKESETRNNILGVKIKEKDQEVRLNEMKVKQLNRRMPHKTLKPLFTARDRKLKNSSSTYYKSQPMTSRGPFDKNSLSRVKNQTQFKIKKRKLPSVSRSKRSNLRSPEVVVEEEPEDERQNNIKTDAEESLKSPTPKDTPSKEKHEIQNIRDKISESKISPTPVDMKNE